MNNICFIFLWLNEPNTRSTGLCNCLCWTSWGSFQPSLLQFPSPAFNSPAFPLGIHPFKFAESALYHIIWIVNKDITCYWPQQWLLRDATGNQLPAQLVPLITIPLVQHSSWFSSHLCTFSVLIIFGSKDTMRDSIKNVTKVKVCIIHCFPLLHTASYLVTEDNVTGQAKSVIGLETAL